MRYCKQHRLGVGDWQAKSEAHIDDQYLTDFYRKAFAILLFLPDAVPTIRSAITYSSAGR